MFDSKLESCATALQHRTAKLQDEYLSLDELMWDMSFPGVNISCNDF